MLSSQSKPILKAWGARIRSIRREVFGENQAAFAQRLELSRDTVSRMERGSGEVAAEAYLTALALGGPLDSLTAFSELPQDRPFKGALDVDF